MTLNKKNFSKTEKMACLIGPWMRNSMNRSLRVKKLWMSRKKSKKSYTSFYHKRTTKSESYTLYVQNSGTMLACG